jgi:hypothetical protein
MATCYEEISNLLTTKSIDDIDQIFPNTRTNFSIGAGNKHIFVFKTSKQDTVKFSTELYPSGSNTSIKMIINIFSYDENTKSLIDLGSTLIEEMFQDFQKDLTAGTFFMCVTNYFSTIDAYITGIFSGFESWAKISAVFSEGSSVITTVTQKRPERVCTRPIFYDLIDGNLPPGISLLSTGRLYGTLPNLDCCDENANLSPSADWFGQYPTGEWHPWGRQWRFKVRITLPGFPLAIDERWFCIRVYNNWDIEKENFKKQLPFSKTYDVIVEPENDIVLESQCLECDIKTPSAERKIIELKALCDPCNPGSPDDASLATGLQIPDKDYDERNDAQTIKIPNGIDVSSDNLISWYMKTAQKSQKEIDTPTKELMKKLINSRIFINLLIKKRIIEADSDKLTRLENVRITLRDNKGRIQLRQSVLLDGRNKSDIDYEFLMNVNKLNQSLPMEFIIFSGEYSCI